MFGTRRRTFKELQLIILKALKDERHTICEISRMTFLHLNVVKHHLILLKGMDYVNLEFEHNRFKLFSITPSGLKYYNRMTEEKEKIYNY